MKHIIIIFSLIIAPVIYADKPSDQLKHGLAAHYFSDPFQWDGNWPDSISVPSTDPALWTFKNYSYSRIEPLINHQFIRHGWFSIRWKGFLDTRHDRSENDRKTKKGADYIFEIHADDGCRLIIDGKLIIDDWCPCSEKSAGFIRKSAAIFLEDGLHEIIVEYFQGQSLEKQDKDPMKLFWQSEEMHIPRQIIPASHFFHNSEQAENPYRTSISNLNNDRK